MRQLQHLLLSAFTLSLVSVYALGQSTDQHTGTLSSSSSETTNEAAGAKAGFPFVHGEIWTVHLTFTPEQWSAMEPVGGPGGAPGQRGPGRFGPAMFLAPVFLTQGDSNQDGKLSDEEFKGLSEKWFNAADTEKTGRVNTDQLRKGLNITLAPPAGAMGMPGLPPGRESFLQGAEGKRNGVASAMGIEFKYVRANLEFEGERFEDVAVRYKG
ncbi:MAG: hypothetical protein EOP84_16460, partial [Verrucomicrobiaceae bacterium]